MDHHLALALSLVGLALGPVLAGVLSRRSRLYAGLDGFVLLVVGGLCLTQLLPHAFQALGGWALPLAVAGFLIPLLAERRLHQLKRQAHGEMPWVVVIAVVGLAVHATLDGAALAGGGHEGDAHEHNLTLAILMHRLPVSLLIWWTVPPSLGSKVAYGTLGLLGAATGLGFVLSPQLEPLIAGWGTGLVNALLAGGLLHVILDHPAPAAGIRRHPGFSAVGATVGVGLFALLPLEPIPGADRAWATTLQLFHESSPAILLGFLGAGLLHLVPSETLSRLMTGRSVASSALRGVVFGLPLPICSCGVVPIYRGLMQKGIPPAAAIAFLIATPELGMDSILISIPLLGVELTLVRLVAALSLALIAGVVAGTLARGEVSPLPPGCESTMGPVEEGSAWSRALHYGFGDSVDDLGPWILAGLIVAGICEPLIDEAWIEALPPMADVPLLALVAAPFYVCASAATPLAAVFLGKGLAAGAVIAFLLTGPATNVTTYGAVRTAHGRGITLALIATIIITSIGLGLLINLLPLDSGSPALDPEAHEVSWLGRVTGVAFLLLLMTSLFRQGPRGFLGRLGLAHDHDSEEHGHDHEHDQQDPPPHEPKGCCDGE